MARWHRIARRLAVLWSVASAALLLVISVGILSQPGFPLDLGAIHATGLAGLWVTLVPATVALAGVMLLRRRGRVGAMLLMVYCAFWAVLVASGVPAVWNARSSFCLNGLGICITSPWLGRGLALGLCAAFLSAGVSFLRRATRDNQAPA